MATDDAGSDVNSGGCSLQVLSPIALVSPDLKSPSVPSASPPTNRIRCGKVAELIKNEKNRHKSERGKR
jgi:hypothetical protein